MNKDYKIELIGSIENEINDNIDVFVNFENGQQYVGTFFTLKNIGALLDSYRKTGENLGGIYFWASDMIILEQMSEEIISETISDMLEDESFFKAFSPTNEKAKEHVLKIFGNSSDYYKIFSAPVDLKKFDPDLDNDQK